MSRKTIQIYPGDGAHMSLLFATKDTHATDRNTFMPSKNTFKPLSVAFLTGILVACVSGSETTDRIEGVFLDSAVQGLSYKANTTEGVTAADGTFTADRGRLIEFYIGDLKLPSVLAKQTITPLDIFNTSNIDDPRVVNLSRLLQSLDKDGNPDNGIVIDPVAALSATPVDFASATFDAQVANLVANSGSVTVELIDGPSALEHLQATLNSNSVTVGDCGTDHPLVGKSASFSTRFHQVAGEITVKDNCTLEVTNFTYDGLGPRVFFYGATDSNFGGSTAFAMGPRLNGRPYNGETITFKLPQSKTLDDMNSVSVWCADVDIDFGSAVFE